MNKVILIGRLTKNPELSKTPTDISVCKFSLAVPRDFKGENGETETDFFNIIVWRGQADNCGKYLSKGKLVAIVGTIQNRAYEDKDGAKKTITEIQAKEVQFLSSKEETSDETNKDTTVIRRERPRIEEVDDDDLPF